MKLRKPIKLSVFLWIIQFNKRVCVVLVSAIQKNKVNNKKIKKNKRKQLNLNGICTLVVDWLKLKILFVLVFQKKV